MRFRGATLAAIGALFVYEGKATAGGGLPLDPSAFANPSSLISPTTANGLVKTVGLVTDHRPYQTATPLGTLAGVDFGVELTIVKVPDDFGAALAAAGMGSATVVPFLPIPKLHLHKGLGPAVDVGGSYISYQNYHILGGDLKIAISQPEEGLTTAIRFCYTSANMAFVNTKTYTPQILFSKKLDFVDPYFGFGYQYATGQIVLSGATGFPAPYDTVTITQSGSGGGFLAFLGLPIKVPNAGIKLTLEGAYSSGGATSLGTKVGLEF